MSKQTVIKKFLGTGGYMAKMSFAHNRKNYIASMKFQIEIFDGRNSEGVFNCSNIAEAAQKIKTFYSQKTGMDLEARRLARWFIEYFEEAGINPPDINDLLADMESTPEEVEAREGN